MRTFCRGFFGLLALGSGLLPVPGAAVGYRLAIAPAGNQVVISWPVAATNYALQSITSLSTTNWLTVTNPAPVTLDHTNVLTYTNNSLMRFFRLALLTNPTSSFAGMALVPAGSFTMGNSSRDSDITDANPTNVTVSMFYMDTNLVSYSLWQSVYNWATDAGYDFANSGSAQTVSQSVQPVQSVNWYDAVKWCNARSQQAGLAPVYFTDAGLTQVYTNGQIDAIYANWSATGYRLPTESEWEKAARGGLGGKRFPWGDTISENLANYYGDAELYSYDLGPDGYDYRFVPNGNPFAFPFTSPVGYFAPNGYGLYDMSGNVCQWCWDWYGTPYAGGTDPRGPAASISASRTLRGGDWGDYASVARCADRNQELNTAAPGKAYFGTGFRCVRAH
jgi:formylglycine-generating enzyme required for sulfatase activity